MSGQWVNPKKTRKGRPLKSCSVTVRSFWSVRRNGPPIAATCWDGGADGPANRRITPKQSTNPARKAIPTIRTRIVRGLILDRSVWRRLEASRQAGDDHLVEDRR